MLTMYIKSRCILTAKSGTGAIGRMDGDQAIIGNDDKRNVVCVEGKSC